MDDVLPSLDDMQLKSELDLELPMLADDSPAVTRSSRKRSGVKLEDSDTPSRKKLKRGFAPPEQYAHLSFLSDYIQDGLDGTLLPFLARFTLRANGTPTQCSFVASSM